MRSLKYPLFPLAELHAHLSTAINPSVYWQIAHAQGFKLPKREYKEFIEYITLSEDRKMSLDDYLHEIYHPLLNKLSSGTYALEKAVYEIFSGGYRNGITLMELRTNPMKHNNNAELDLDHIIMAMLHGMERALLEYENLSAGIIFCMAREFSYEQNAILVEKAIKYKNRGVIAIDVAGPANPDFHLKDYKDLFDKARKEGLEITIHSGEVTAANDMWEAIEFGNPSRIGHGVLAAKDEKLMQVLSEKKIVLEICPLSNLATKAVENIEELKFIFQKFKEHNVLFTINTDWPETIKDAHLWKQFRFLKEQTILSEEQLETCNKIAFESSFIKSSGLTPYL
ncbi:MAG: adenosine deaminase [Candidatus Levybacteria bacterium]|nr:adenosine deaminase [Candidatus Levybacteria bacterium]